MLALSVQVPSSQNLKEKVAVTPTQTMKYINSSIFGQVFKVKHINTHCIFRLKNLMLFGASSDWKKRPKKGWEAILCCGYIAYAWIHSYVKFPLCNQVDSQS